MCITDTYVFVNPVTCVYVHTVPYVSFSQGSYTYIIRISFTVPIPLVYVSISDNNYEISGDDSFGQDGNITRNLAIGDPLILDCTVIAVRGISSSVDILWTTGGRVVKRVDNITADIENDNAIYTDSFKISSLSVIDNGREYQCTVVINANQPVYSNDQITLKFPGEYNIYVYT